jgi:hypothetical protein
MSAVHDEQQSNPFSAEELVALRALIAKPQRPWWQDYPFLVSVLAFTLSLLTSIISAYVAHARDIHDQQSQLAATLGTIQDLNLKQVELHEKYKNTPYEAQVGGLIANQANSALHTAATLGLQLGTKATSADLTAVAQGVYGLGEYQLSLKLLQYALAAAESANDKSIALRDLGFYAIRAGKGGTALKTGEDYFQQALDLDREFDLSDQPLVIAWLKSSAQFGWASAVAPIDCAAAQRHFSEGVKVLLSAPVTIDFDQARSGAKQQWITGIGGVPNCVPDPSTPTLP